jgi:hypothetical protein
MALKKFALFARLGSAPITALALTCLPARALTVTTPILNAPQTLNTTSDVGLSFLSFNQANFPSITGLSPTQVLRLNSVQIQTKGTAAGTFTVTNASTTTPVPVSSGAFNYQVLANNIASTSQTPSSQTGLTNTTGSVGVATSGSLSTTVPTCTPPSFVGSSIFGGTTYYFCTTPGSNSFTLNQPATSSNSFNWFVSPLSGETNSINSSFWTAGATLSLDSRISFTPNPGAFSGGVLSPSSPAFTYLLSSTPADTFLTYDYDIVEAIKVPAPLPLLGAAFGFGFTRRLRRRIQSASTLNS